MEKVSLPIKTKIAAWLTIAVGVLGTGIAVHFVWKSLRYWGKESLSYFLLVLLFCGFQFATGLFLLKKKKWAWWGNEIILAIELIGYTCFSFFMWASILLFVLYNPDCFFTNCDIHPLGHFYNVLGELLIPVILVIVPFILLLLDRKNFWKIAT